MVVAQENQQSGTSLQSIHSISRLPDLDVWAAPKPTLPIANERILILPAKAQVPSHRAGCHTIEPEMAPAKAGIIHTSATAPRSDSSTAGHFPNAK